MLVSKTKSKTHPTIHHVKWNSPIIGYKLNTDEFSLENSGRGGIGGLIRDQMGNWIIIFSLITLARNYYPYYMNYA